MEKTGPLIDQLPVPEAAQFIAKSDQIDHQTKEKEENAVVGVIK